MAVLLKSSVTTGHILGLIPRERSLLTSQAILLVGAPAARVCAVAAKDWDRYDVPAADGARLKRTFYLDRGAVVALSELQAEEVRLTGRNPDLSEMASRAIRTLRKHG